MEYYDNRKIGILENFREQFGGWQAINPICLGRRSISPRMRPSEASNVEVVVWQVHSLCHVSASSPPAKYHHCTVLIEWHGIYQPFFLAHPRCVSSAIVIGLGIPSNQHANSVLRKRCTAAWDYAAGAIFHLLPALHCHVRYTEAFYPGDKGSISRRLEKKLIHLRESDFPRGTICKSGILRQRLHFLRIVHVQRHWRDVA